MRVFKGLRASPLKPETYVPYPLNGAKRCLAPSSQAVKPDAAVSVAAAYGYTVAPALEAG